MARPESSFRKSMPDTEISFFASSACNFGIGTRGEFDDAACNLRLRKQSHAQRRKARKAKRGIFHAFSSKRQRFCRLFKRNAVRIDPTAFPSFCDFPKERMVL